MPIGATFQRINKYVLTHSDKPLEWANSHRLSGDTAQAVAGLKQTAGRDLLIQGSSTLYMPLLAAGLIDRLVVMTFPVILGGGKSIFDGPPASGALKLTQSAVSDKGVIFAMYEPAGRRADRQFRRGAMSSRADAEWSRRMSLELYAHPFSSLLLEGPDPARGGWHRFHISQRRSRQPRRDGGAQRFWPLGKFPLLVDDGEVVAETTCIIEHLQARHPGPNVWIPEGELGRRVRFLDRFFDLHIQGNMQPAVDHALRPEGQGDSYGAEQGLKKLRHRL